MQLVAKLNEKVPKQAEESDSEDEKERKKQKRIEKWQQQLAQISFRSDDGTF